MNDAERDAWLREALRHAPDSGAAPPSLLNDAILAKARAAAARPAAAPGPREATRRASAHPLLALWDWLARPPVAAGFASVMAATLVGLMWWDRPMDETMARAPAVDRVEAPRAAAPTTPAPTTGAAIEPSAPGAAVAPPPVVADAARAQTVPEAPAPTRPAKLAETERAEPANAKDQRAKERAPADAPPNDKAAAFPAPEFQRDAPAPAPRTIAAPTPPLADAKKESAAPPSTPAPAAAPAPAPLAAAQRQAPQAAAQVAPTPPSLARGRVARDEATDATSNRLDGGSAKSGAAAEASAEAKNDATASTGALAAPARPPVAQPLEKKANAFPPEGAAARHDAPAEGRRATGVTAPAPLAPLLTALAGDAARVSRQSANGGWSAIEPAWRDWLSDLAAATNGRWRAGFDGAALDADAAKPLAASTVLRVDGQVAATIRIDGTTVQVDSQLGASRRWQATLAPAVAERLRASFARLPP